MCLDSFYNYHNCKQLTNASRHQSDKNGHKRSLTSAVCRFSTVGDLNNILFYPPANCSKQYLYHIISSQTAPIRNINTHPPKEYSHLVYNCFPKRGKPPTQPTIFQQPKSSKDSGPTASRASVTRSLVKLQELVRPRGIFGWRFSRSHLGKSNHSETRDWRHVVVMSSTSSMGHLMDQQCCFVLFMKHSPSNHACRDSGSSYHQ